MNIRLERCYTPPGVVGPMRRDRILWLWLIVGAALRFWRIRGDLPYVLHYDEPTLVDNAVWLIQHRSLNPHFLNYPTGLIYLLAFLYGIVLLGGLLVGRFENGAAAITWLSSGTYPQPAEGGVLYFYPTIGVPTLYLIGRSVSALAGVGTIALIYALALRCTKARGVARLAGLFVAISPLAVEHAHLITTDTVCAALATACLLAALRAEEGGGRWWVIAGAFGGLAAGVKYNAALVLLVLPLLAAWRLRRDRAVAFRSLVYAATAAVLVFLAVTPFAILDAPRFVRDLGYEFHRVGSVTASFEGAEAVEATPVEKVAEIFWHNLGIFGILALVWGGVLAARSRRYGPTAILLWVVVAILPLLRWRSLYARYLLAPWPALLLLVGWATADLATRIGHALRDTLRMRALPAATTVVLAGMVLAPGTVRLVTREARRAQPDPRIEMTRWIEQNIPSGEWIVSETGGPFLDCNRYSLERIDFIGRQAPDAYLARGVHTLVGTGRERLVQKEKNYGDVLANLKAIQEHSDRLWSRDRYAVYRLRGGVDWEEPVRQALAAADSSGARRILEQTVRDGGGTAYSWRTLGDLRAQLGDTSAAMQAYLEASRHDSADLEARLSLADLETRTGDWSAALRHLEDARVLSPREPLIQHNLAVVHLYRAQDRIRKGDRRTARADWESARSSAEVCARTAPGDPRMTGIHEQVLRMGRRWGFVR